MQDKKAQFLLVFRQIIVKADIFREIAVPSRKCQQFFTFCLTEFGDQGFLDRIRPKNHCIRIRSTAAQHTVVIRSLERLQFFHFYGRGYMGMLDKILTHIFFKYGGPQRKYHFAVGKYGFLFVGGL